MAFVKFHNIKQKKKSNVPFKLKQTLFFFTYFFNYSQQVKIILTICPQLMFSKFKQMFSFSFVTIYALSIFPKNIRFFFLFYAVFNSVRVSLLLFFFSCLFHCPVVLFFYNKLLIHYFFNLISASLCIDLNIITIGSCTPVYSNSNKYFHKTSMVR